MRKARFQNIVGEPTSGSQGGVLRQRLHEAEVTHGETVVASIPNVRVDKKGVLYFCNVPKVAVTRVLKEGDQNPVTAWLLRLTKGSLWVRPGHGTLRGVVVSNNGVLGIDLSEAKMEYAKYKSAVTT